VNHITTWTKTLLGEHAGMVEMEATLFVEILAVAAADVAMRALLVTFIPAPSTIEDFMKSNTYQSPSGIVLDASIQFMRSTTYLPPSVALEPAAIVLDASIQFIKLLSERVRNTDWMKYRIFMQMLGYPVENAGEKDEIEPNWISESDWIKSRFNRDSVSVVWEEFVSMMNSSPNILLLLVSKAIPSVEEKKKALLCIPSSYLLEKFPFIRNDDVSCHFIGLCLNDSVREITLDVFSHYNLVNDRFCEELIQYAFADHRLLHRVFNVLQNLLLTRCAIDSSLDRFPNISIVLIKFLVRVSQQDNIRDVKIFGCFILLILQLEERKAHAAVASEWMRRDNANRDQVISL